MTSTVKNSPNFATTALNRLLQHQGEAMGPAAVVKWLRVNKYPLLYLDIDALPKELVDTPEFLQALADDQASNPGQLQRRKTRTGRESVDHPAGGSDDAANSLAGVVYLLLKRRAHSFDDWSAVMQSEEGAHEASVAA